VGKASSAKKVARAAKAGGRVKVRRQGGMVFPISLALVLVVGVALVAYARHTTRNTAQTPPTTTDHWHEAYGFYICNAFTANITDNNEDQSSPGYLLFRQTGIHTHGDGVIHVHPYGSAGTGRNAKLGTFFKQVGVTLTDTTIQLPKELGSVSKKNGDLCDGKPGKLQVVVWDDAAGTADGLKRITDFGNTRFTKNGMAFTIAFVADGVSVPKPTSAANLAALGATDTGQTSTQETSATTTSGTTEVVGSTVPGTTTAAGATTVPGATTVAGATTTLGSGSSTAAGSSSTTAASSSSASSSPATTG
jgi:hypothetical protein